MKTSRLNYVYECPGLKEVNITNNLASLYISPSKGECIEIEVEIPYDSEDMGAPDDLVQVNINDDNANIEFDYLPEIRGMFWDNIKGRITIAIPDAVRLVVETENLPINLNGLSAEIDLRTENGSVVIVNCNGKIELESENGPVKLHNCAGDQTYKLENGLLSAEVLSGDQISVESENGAIKLRSVCFAKVDVSTENGSIYYETLPVDSGEMSFSSENGSISLILPMDFDFHLEAKTENGILKNRLDAILEKRDDIFVISKGETGPIIHVNTENGVIKLSSDGHMNLDYLKQKLAQLRDAVNASKSLEDKENIQKLLNNILAYAEKALGEVKEEKIKAAIQGAMDTLRQTISDFDVEQAKDSVVSNVEKIGDEIADGFRQFYQEFRSKVEKEFTRENVKVHMDQVHKEMKNVKEYIKKMVRIPDFVMQPGGMSPREKSDVADRSRIKILEMLESGKITAEEAERLLKAIGKE